MPVVPGWRDSVASGPPAWLAPRGLNGNGYWDGAGRYDYGLGDAAQTTGIINTAAQAGGIVASGGDLKSKLVVSAPSIAAGVLTAGGSSSIAAGIWGAAAIPVIGAVVAGVTVGLLALFSRKGPAQKVATTKIVDQVEPLLQQNLKGYLEGPRTPEAQAQALANFDAGWQYILEKCGDPIMGEPGQRCVSERTRGGSAPWCPTGTGCDWFTLYRDPIANDVPVQSATGGGLLDSVFGPSAPGEGSSVLPLLLGAGLLGAVLLL